MQALEIRKWCFWFLHSFTDCSQSECNHGLARLFFRNPRVARRALLELLRRDLKPRDIMTRSAFENAMVLIMALGGSTNAVGH